MDYNSLLLQPAAQPSISYFFHIFFCLLELDRFHLKGCFFIMMKQAFKMTIACYIRFIVLQSIILFMISSAPVASLSSLTTSSKNLHAAVLVPGFLTGADEFQTLCDALTKRGLPTVAVPMPNWHWLPCLGGRSSRPILERIDFTVQHLLANDGDISKIPKYEYTLLDLWKDFRTNPGGVFEVGGSSKVDEYPVVEPHGRFPLPDPELIAGKKLVLIGHSAGGWISRIYLSDRDYGGKIYHGSDHVHSLVTLGTPHVSAPSAAFEGIQWCNQEVPNVPALAVGGTGFKGDSWGALTQGAYNFCCPDGTDGTSYDGDGMTPLFSSLGMNGAEQMVVEGVGHFHWSDVFGGGLVAPELTKDHKEGRPWYGSEEIVDQWVSWVLKQSS